MVVDYMRDRQGKFREVHKVLTGSNKGWFKKGQRPSQNTEFKKGEHPSERTEFKKGHGMNKKEENPSWLGGKSFEPYTLDWTETLRRSIRERDNYICQLCSQYGNAVHHIDYDKKNCNPDNLINLCRKCNTKVNFNRKHWTKVFQQWILDY